MIWLTCHHYQFKLWKVYLFSLIVYQTDKMVSVSRAYINDTVLCGDRGFVVWDQSRNDLGQCFQDLAFLLPAQVKFFLNWMYFLTKYCSRHCWELPLPTIWVSKLHTTSWEPSSRNTSWSAAVSWRWWWPCCPSSRRCPCTASTTPQSPAMGRRRYCQGQSRPSPGLSTWCTHTWYTTGSVRPYVDQDQCWCLGQSVFLSI